MKLLYFLTLCLIFISTPQQSSAQDTLKILSWNVFLRPSILGDKQMKRVDSIANHLINSDADVIVVQEVFHRRARKRIGFLMDSVYHFQTKPGPKSIFGVPSGVVIYSKTAFKGEVNYHSFSKGKGSDKMAKKGFVQVVVNPKGKDIAIIGTHLQAGNGEKRKAIRKNQVELISSAKNKIKDSTLLIFAGDFNISSTTPAFDSLIETLKSKTIEPTGKLKNTCNFSDHNLMAPDGQPYWIDFILIREKEAVTIISSIIQAPRQMFKDKKERLSDHNPIISTLVY